MKILICVIFGGCVILIKKLFTFRQKHFTGITQQRFDYIFVSNSLQEAVKNTEILNALSSDHSPIFCSFVNNDTFARGSGVWKFNNSLLLNTQFVKKLRSLKMGIFEIRKFSISFLKNFAKTERIIQTNLENRI